MKVKEPFLDYEPLRRTPASESVVEDPAGDFSFKKPAAAPPREEKSEIEKSEIEPAKETWIHKHGHSLSYAGVFLFTTLVFFRPYELSPSLFWLSETPFWVAVATLAVFIITQLGLENRITARPREVNLVLLLLVTGILSMPLALEPSRAFDGFIGFLKVVLIFIVIINV
jgi:hypothetical protein